MAVLVVVPFQDHYRDDGVAHAMVEVQLHQPTDDEVMVNLAQERFGWLVAVLQLDTDQLYHQTATG